MAASSRQKRIAGRVMHEFKHAELNSGPGGKGGAVKSRRQAIAIALSESGASNRQSPSRNARHERRAERDEARGETGQQQREGRSHIGARDKRESTPAMGGRDARQPTARGRKAATARARRDDGLSRIALYALARRKGVAGRSRMSKQQLKTALGVE